MCDVDYQESRRAHNLSELPDQRPSAPRGDQIIKEDVFKELFKKILQREELIAHEVRH
jgi:hypothetical protein